MFKENPKLKNIFFAGFLFSLHMALTAYVNSSFLSIFLEEKTVGLLYTIGYIISVIALLVIPKMLIKIGSYRFLLALVALSSGALLLLSMSQNAFLIVPVFVLYLGLNIMIVFSLDELLQISSRNSGIGKVRGLYVAILSSAWVIAQAFSGAIISNFSFSALYLMSFMIMIILLVFSYFFLKNLPDPDYDKEPILKSLKVFFKNPNLARSYKINFLLQFFFAFMVIYTPLYLSAHLGFSWKEIGLIFTIMLTPFIILPLSLGKYSDKIGERKLLMLGFTLASLATLSLFFITKPILLVWVLLMFITRIGASIIETMSDVYFFKHITPENDESIGIYRNAHPVAYILAPLVAILIFDLAPSFNFMFPILGGFMLYGVYLSSTIRKSDI